MGATEGATHRGPGCFPLAAPPTAVRGTLDYAMSLLEAAANGVVTQTRLFRVRGKRLGDERTHINIKGSCAPRTCAMCCPHESVFGNNRFSGCVPLFGGSFLMDPGNEEVEGFVSASVTPVIWPWSFCVSVLYIPRGRHTMYCSGCGKE